jgi:hypothetical protein
MDEATKRKRAQYIIDNDGDFDDLRREVEHVLSRYLKIPGEQASAEPAPTTDAPPVPVGLDVTLPPPRNGDDQTAGEPIPESELDTLPPRTPAPETRTEESSDKKEAPRLPPPSSPRRKRSGKAPGE